MLGIAKGTVISTLKKSGWNHPSKPVVYTLASESTDGLEVRLEAVCEAELDEQWSFVGKKSNQRWLWHAVDHATNTVIAYVFGKRKDVVLINPTNSKLYNSGISVLF